MPKLDATQDALKYLVVFSLKRIFCGLHWRVTMMAACVPDAWYEYAFKSCKIRKIFLVDGPPPYFPSRAIDVSRLF